MRITIPQQSKPIFDFVVQVVFGAIGFLVVFGAATLISILVKSAEGVTPDWVQIGAGYAEKALFAVDLFCFGLFILSETLKLIRGLWNEWRR
jgi:hypothetical protein